MKITIITRKNRSNQTNVEINKIRSKFDCVDWKLFWLVEFSLVVTGRSVTGTGWRCVTAELIVVFAVTLVAESLITVVSFDGGHKSSPAKKWFLNFSINLYLATWLTESAVNVDVVADFWIVKGNNTRTASTFEWIQIIFPS